MVVFSALLRLLDDLRGELFGAALAPCQDQPLDPFGRADHHTVRHHHDPVILGQHNVLLAESGFVQDPERQGGHFLLHQLAVLLDIGRAGARLHQPDPARKAVEVHQIHRRERLLLALDHQRGIRHRQGAVVAQPRLAELGHDADRHVRVHRRSAAAAHAVRDQRHGTASAVDKVIQTVAAQLAVVAHVLCRADLEVIERHLAHHHPRPIALKAQLGALKIPSTGTVDDAQQQRFGERGLFADDDLDLHGHAADLPRAAGAVRHRQPLSRQRLDHPLGTRLIIALHRRELQREIVQDIAQPRELSRHHTAHRGDPMARRLQRPILAITAVNAVRKLRRLTAMLDEVVLDVLLPDKAALLQRVGQAVKVIHRQPALLLPAIGTQAAALAGVAGGTLIDRVRVRLIELREPVRHRVDAGADVIERLGAVLQTHGHIAADGFLRGARAVIGEYRREEVARVPRDQQEESRRDRALERDRQHHRPIG